MRKNLTISILLTLILAVTFFFLLHVREKQGKAFSLENKISSLNGIEWNGFIDIDSTKQWILIRGEDSTKEVILFIHGGPGIPETILAQKKYQGLIEKNFTVVHWEQRGSCKSFNADRTGDKVSIDQCVSDAQEVTAYLLKRFKKKKIFLIGHSWGTIIAVKLIRENPSEYAGYIGISQVVNALEQERLSLDYCRKSVLKSANVKEQKKLGEIGDVPYVNVLNGITIERSILANYGGWVWGDYTYEKFITELFSFSHYSITDLLNFNRGIDNANKAIFTDKFWDLKLDKTDTSFNVPLCLFIGKHDYTTPFILAEHYYDIVNAPIKEKVYFDNSAHVITTEEPSRYQEEVIRFFSRNQ